MPLINVLAVNSKVVVFMYAEDFSGVEKTGVAIAEFLIKAIEEIGPSNVHSQILAIFRANSNLELLKVAKTRFASHYILLKRLLVCREALATTIVLNSWKEWVKQGDENTRKMGALVAEIIESESFWEEVGNVVKITKLIYLLIKFAEGEGPKMGEFYEKMDVMLGEVHEIMKRNKYASCYSKMQRIITARWTKMNYTIHCLGFALTPRFYDTYYLATLAPRGVARKAPNLDKEVVTAVMEAFEKISENSDEQKLLREQFVTFHAKKGKYALSATQLDAVTMDAIDWWSTYESETPELVEVGKKVFSQPISSSSAERSWSTYSDIHSVKRNRLNCERADKLVYIHSNIHLQSRFSESYKYGPFKNWDVDYDDTNLGESFLRLHDTSLELHNQINEGVDDNENARKGAAAKRGKKIKN